MRYEQFFFQHLIIEIEVKCHSQSHVFILISLYGGIRQNVLASITHIQFPINQDMPRDRRMLDELVSHSSL